jgi:type VI secretion system secreted protein VgrG
MAKAIQAHRQIAVGTPLGDDVLLLRGFTFREQLGRPFEMTLDMVSDTSDIKFADIVGQNVTVRIQKPMDDQTRYYNGIVRQFVQMPGSGRTTQYTATVVPWLWLLTRTSDCRIFQDKTVPDIIKEVFRVHGLTDFEDRLSGSYRTWEYCVQYRETDFNFVSRLMEQEGIYYFFTHENGKHKMTLVDSKSSHEPLAGYESIPFRPPSTQFREKEFIHEVAIAQEVQPGTYAHTDYDFKSPKKDLQTKSLIQRQHAQADFELFDYPGVFVEYGEGESYSRVRIEELHTGFEVARCKTNARGVATGCKFTMADHPRADLNKDFLVVDSTVTASTDEFDSAPGATTGTTFQCGFECIDLQSQFRTARTTRKPEIRGPQTAVVAGPAGEEIHTDKYGRVKVQFHWDRYSKADENSSCWIRVSQAVAGKKWGQLFLPRIGQEVIVEFLEGDPDRPIITGRVYNGVVMPPYELPANKTMSTLKSNSSKGGAGFNEIRFEDKKGEEQIFIHGEKNQDIRIKNDRFEWIGNNRHLIVKKDKFEHVENKRHEIVDVDHMEEIGKDRHLKVKGKEAKEIADTQSLKVGGNVAEKFGANHSEDVGMSYYLKGGMTIVIEAGAGITLKCGGNSVVIDPAGVTVKGTMVTLDGTMTMINSGPGSPAGSGSAGTIVPPTAPTAAEEADKADPGEVEDVKARQRELKAGKYGSTQVPPYKPNEEKKSWVEIKLVDKEGRGIAGERYRVELPDGTVAEGTLNDKGEARLDGIDPGACNVTFPDRDGKAWKPK